MSKFIYDYDHADCKCHVLGGGPYADENVSVNPLCPLHGDHGASK